jgi:uncharacterized cupredoxin-like copper-binding protein
MSTAGLDEGRSRMALGRRVWLFVTAAALLALLLPACGGGETVDVTLQEFAVGVDPASASAGEVTFSVTNDGPDDVHEFVVIRTDLAPTDLPTDETGAVDEEGEGIEEVVNEIEDIPVGTTEELTVDLDAGNYVLICNIYDEEEQEAHYSEGMRAAFTVE